MAGASRIWAAPVLTVIFLAGGCTAPSAVPGTDSGSPAGTPGAASPAASSVPSEATAVPTAVPTSAVPLPSAAGPETPAPPPTGAPTNRANWKTFSSVRAGLAFDYPAQWSVLVEQDEELDSGNYMVLGIRDKLGNRIASVHTSLAIDADGEGSHRRTVIDEADVPGLSSWGRGAKVYLEHAEMTDAGEPGLAPESYAAMFIADRDGYDPAATEPQLQTFSYDAEDHAAWFQVEPGFWYGTRVNARNPTEEQLRRFTSSTRYQVMKQVMLSCRAAA